MRTMADAGVKKSWSNQAEVTFTAFWVNQRNAIIYTGDILETVPGRIMELYGNRDQFQYGAELAINSPLLFNRTTSLFFNATSMKSMADLGDKFSRNRELPEWIANTGINVDWHKFDLNLYGNYSSVFYSTRFAVKSAGEVKLGDYIRIDLNLGYTFGKTGDWRFYVALKNLSGREYSTVVGYPDPGRLINTGIMYHFKRKKQ